MYLLQVLKDLRWIGKNYGVRLTVEEIGDFLREEPDFIKREAMLGSFGASTEDGRYNSFNVVYWRNRLDKEEKIALHLVLLRQARTTWNMGEKKNKPHKRGSERSVTTRKNGLLMCYVYRSDGTRYPIYDRDENLIRSRADLLEMEEEQKQLLGIISEVAPEHLERLSDSVTAVLEEERGKAKQKGTKKDKKENAAKISEEKVIQEILAPSEEKSKAPTFEEAFKIWTKYLRDEQIVTNQTVDRHNMAYNRHIKKHKNFITKPIDKITTNDVHAILRSIINSKVTKKEYNEPRQVIRDTFGYFIAEDEYDYDIKVDFVKVELKLKNLKRKFVVRKKDENAIGKELRDDIEKAIDEMAYKSCIKKSRYYLVKLNFYLGLREAELGALTVDDIDLERGIVTVNKAEIHYREVDKNGEYTGNQIYEIAETKTETGNREIPLVKEAHDIAVEIFTYRKRRGYRNKELIYDGEDRPIKDRVGKLYNTYAYVAKRVGLTTKEFRSHLQRKTFATYLSNHNVDPADIKEFMGHSDITTTMKYYILPEKKKLENKREALQSALS